MMKEMEIAGRKCLLLGDQDSQNILIQAGDDHGLSLLEKEYELIRQSVDRPFGLLALKITNWNKELSPWLAPAVFGTEDFGDGAAETLKFITGHLMDKEKSYYLGGYSLAGFFALWSASQCDLFAGVAGVSPSVWFPGWKEYFNEHPLKSDRVYLSLGDREERTRNKTMATVGDNIRYIYEVLRKDHDCILEWNPGNHFQEPEKRLARGFAWLLQQ